MGSIMKVTAKDACEMAGVSRSKLYKDMDAGHLSYTERNDALRGRFIDVSELERVYGTLKTPDTTENTSTDVNMSTAVENKKNSTPKESAIVPADLLELSVLREKVKMMEETKKAEMQTLEVQIDIYKNMVEKLEAQNKQTIKLLEDKTQRQDEDSRWDKVIDGLEKKIDAQNTASEDKIAKLEENNRKLMRALTNEKNKSFWQKLFG